MFDRADILQGAAVIRKEGEEFASVPIEDDDRGIDTSSFVAAPFQPRPDIPRLGKNGGVQPLRPAPWTVVVIVR
jgi:hypothetical protein